MTLSKKERKKKKKKGEVRLLIPARYTTLTTDLGIARILENELNGELNGRAVKLKNIAMDVNNFPQLFLSCIEAVFTLFFRSFIFSFQ